jgi:cysteine synthase A
MNQFESCDQVILKSIGNTPIVTIHADASLGEVAIHAKCEFLNPSGSHKDRMYLYGIRHLEEVGFIHKGMTLVDFSSGNAGASLSMLAAVFGYKAIIVRPEGLSLGKAIQIRAYGGKIVESPASGGIGAARDVALQIVKEMGENAFMMYQTDLEYNVEAFYPLGDEIVEHFRSKSIRPDVFVCPVGTGGTLTAVARRLKTSFPESRIIAVEIEEGSTILPRLLGKDVQTKPHTVEGVSVGETFKNTDVSIIDEVEICGEAEAWKMRNWMSENLHLFVGPSSGAAFSIAKRVANRLPKGGNIITIFWDQGWKYGFDSHKEY